MHSSQTFILAVFSCFATIWADSDLELNLNIYGTDCSSKSTDDCKEHCEVKGSACGCKYEQIVQDVCYKGAVSNVFYASSVNLSGWVAPDSDSMVTRSHRNGCWHQASDGHGEKWGTQGTYKKYDCTGKNDGEMPAYTRYKDSACATLDDTTSSPSFRASCLTENARPENIGKDGVWSTCRSFGCTSTNCDANAQTCTSGKFSGSSVYPCKYSDGKCSCDTTVSQFRKSTCNDGVPSYAYFATSSDCSANQNVVEHVPIDDGEKDRCEQDGHTWKENATTYVRGKWARLSCVNDQIKKLHYTEDQGEGGKCPSTSTVAAHNRTATDDRYMEDCVCVEKYVAPTPAPPITGSAATYIDTYWNGTGSSSSCTGSGDVKREILGDASCYREQTFDCATGTLKNADTYHKLQLSCDSPGTEEGTFRYVHETFSDAACTQRTSKNEGSELKEEACDAENRDGCAYRRKVEIKCGSSLLGSAHGVVLSAAALILSLIASAFAGAEF